MSYVYGLIAGLVIGLVLGFIPGFRIGFREAVAQMEDILGITPKPEP